MQANPSTQQLDLSISPEIQESASKVIRIGASPAKKSEYDACLREFEGKHMTEAQQVRDAVSGDFDRMKEAVRLAQSVTHNEPLPLLGQLLGMGAVRDKAIKLVQDRLNNAVDTPTGRKDFDSLLSYLESDHQSLLLAAVVCASTDKNTLSDLGDTTF